MSYISFDITAYGVHDENMNNVQIHKTAGAHNDNNDEKEKKNFFMSTYAFTLDVTQKTANDEIGNIIRDV